MSKTTYQVMTNMSGDEDHDYDLVVEKTKKGKKFTLHYSNHKEWDESARGEKIMTLLDTGNEVVIKRTSKTMQYDKAFALRLLLNANAMLSDNPVERMGCKLIKKGKKTIQL
jgi:hypothetical protein